MSDTKLGRPPKENPKNIKMNIRISEKTANDLSECADKLEISKVNVIEQGIEMVKSLLEQKK